MEKLVCDGMIAVLVSPGYGLGWYSSHKMQELLFDPTIVDLVMAEQHDKIEPYLTARYGDDLYFGPVDDLTVLWIPQGTDFRIDEYDGAERLVFREQEDWIKA